MKKKITRLKVCLYILLAALTAVFSFVSFRLYTRDVVSRVKPQVERTIVQASKLLPQLEENEDALRKISSNLKKSREEILHANEGLVEEKTESEEDVETIIKETISWMNRITKLRVGRSGHVIVVSKDDLSTLANSDERFIGEKLRLVGRNLDLEDVFDLEEADEEFKNKDLAGGFHLFLPESIIRKDQDTGDLYSALDAGIYGSVFTYGDTYIICGVTLTEALGLIVVRCIFSTLLFFAIVWVFIRYIGFALISHKEELKAFRRKLVSYAVIGITILFFALWYYQTMMDVTGDIATMNNHAEAAVETLNTYEEYRDKLTNWLDAQYLEQCNLAADLVTEKGKENLTREDLAKLAKDLDVEYIYVFDKYGKVLVTNSPYDHFELSTDEEDQSYAFRPLLEGKEYVIQDVRTDDTGEKKQYIGVCLRDENDLCDGFVQIAVDPQLREQLLDPIDVQTVLDNLVIGLPEYALAIDKDTMKIAATTGLGFEGTAIEELGIDPEKIKTGFDGILTINDKTYYTGVSESETLYLMPLVRSTDSPNPLLISCILALYGAAAFILLVIVSLAGYRSVILAGEAEQQEAAGDGPDDDSREKAKKGIWSDVFKAEEKYGFDIRWKKQSAIPVSEQTPEMLTGRIIYRVLLIFCIAFLLFEAGIVYYGITNDVRLDGFSYVLLGDWEKGVNLFSFSFCLFLICVLYVFQELLNQVLYHIAKVSDLKKETILLLLRSALKYTCAIVFLYIGLAQFGIDTRALWASAGVLSLMIGFGAKDLVSDIIAGLFIIFEGTYRIGDWISVGSWFGMVQEIGLRYTRIVYYSDTKIFNNSAMREIVNCNGEQAREVVKVPIPLETDLLEVEKLLDRELPNMEKNIPGLLKPLKYQGVSSVDDGRIVIRIAIYVTPARRKQAVRALLREIKLLFDRKHIRIPYNHVVVSDYREENNTYVDVPEEDADS